MDIFYGVIVDRYYHFIVIKLNVRNVRVIYRVITYIIVVLFIIVVLVVNLMIHIITALFKSIGI